MKGFELAVAIGRVRALPCLRVSLRRVAELRERLPYQRAGNRKTMLLQAFARRRQFFEVQRNGRSVSPRAVGSTSASRAFSSSGCFSVSGLHPPPGRRTRPGSLGAVSPPSPWKLRPMVERATPRDLGDKPDSAPPKASRFGRRRPRSPRYGDRASYRYLIPSVLSIHNIWRTTPRCGVPLQTIHVILP